MSTFGEYDVRVEEEPEEYQRVIPEPPKKAEKRGIKSIWLKYEKNILLFVGMILIGAFCFEAGFLSGERKNPEGVVVNKVAGCTDSKESSSKTNADPETAKTAGSAASKPAPAKDETEITKSESTGESASQNKNCAYVASKNSDKFHLASCQSAKRIKPENRMCFSTIEEATARGFVGAKCCIK